MPETNKNSVPNHPYEDRRIRFHWIYQAGFLIALAGWYLATSSGEAVLAQGETLTETPTAQQAAGIFITVTTTTEDHVNVRMGPGSAIYPIVGTLPVGAMAPALGKSPGGDWIQIEFGSAAGGKGWVYSPLVTLSPGTLSIVEPPPTPLPPPTATIDPTLAAQFIREPTATRLPTFTPAPPMTATIFEDSNPSKTSSPIPLAMIILLLGTAGLIGLVISVTVRNTT